MLVLIAYKDVCHAFRHATATLSIDLLPRLFAADPAGGGGGDRHQLARLSRGQDRDLAGQLVFATRIGSLGDACGVLGDARRVAIGVELCDPETHEWLARARSAEFELTERGWCIALGQPEICFARMARLSEVLHEHLLLRAHNDNAAVHLAASTVTLLDDQWSESLFDVRCAVEGDSAGTEIFIEFRPAAADEYERARLRLVRNRQLDPPATGWELHTGPTGLPCSLACAWLPGLERLGHQATFHGSVWSEQNPRDWQCEVEGNFGRVDLDLLVTGQFKHKLSGFADLALTELKIDRGRITSMSGRLTCEGGVVGASLLQAAEQSLSLQRHERSGEATRLPYQLLSFDFALDAEGLMIAGRCEPQTAVMCDRHGPLLSAVETRRQGVLSFVRMLVPDVDLQVPATRETALLVGRLPLPEVTQSPALNARNNQSPLRLRTE